jgi:drug/metabolite transporter (DMT)-like permease
MGLVQTLFSRKWSHVNIAILYILIAVLASAAGQVLLKKGMGSMGAVTLSLNQLGDILWRIGTNPYVVIGLTVYVCGTIFWLAALSRVDLSYAYPFASLSYLVMLVASWLLFSEDITLARLLGTMVVGLGVFLISQS